MPFATGTDRKPLHDPDDDPSKAFLEVRELRKEFTGQQDLVAIARAIAYQPEVLLMDETFASVDAQTRAELEDMLLGIWDQYRQTILFITHDIEEAIYPGTKVVVISARPSRVLDIVPVDLGRKRDQLSTRESKRFLELRHRVFQAVRAEHHGAGGRKA